MKRSRIPVQINVFSTALLLLSVLTAVLVVVQGQRRARKMAGMTI
jgi:heme/copper-type cytochrome/quinol oxidase subunit 3